MPSDRTESQKRIALREQWINLAAWEAGHAISGGATGEEIMATLARAAETQIPIDGNDNKSEALKLVARAALEAFQRDASLDYVKRRVAVLLWEEGSLEAKRVAKLMGVDDAGLRRLRHEMKVAQAESLRLSINPEEFRHYGIR